MVVGEQIRGSVVLSPVPLAAGSGGEGDDAPPAAPLLYSGSLDLEVQAGSQLLQAAMGGRVLTLGQVALRNLPHQLRLPAPEEGEEEGGEGAYEALPEIAGPDDVQDALAAVADPYDNNMRYVLQLHLPSGAGRAGAPPTYIPSGQLRLVQLPPPPGQAEGKESEGGAAEGDVGAGVPPVELPGAWEWRVEWPSTSAFLPAAQAEALLARLAAGEPVEATVHRVQVEVVEDEEVGIPPAPSAPDAVGAGGEEGGTDDVTAPSEAGGVAPPLSTGHYIEPMFGMRGVRVVKKDLAWRCAVPLHLTQLAQEDALSSGQVTVSVQPLPGTPEETAAEAAAASTREEEWEELAAGMRAAAEAAAEAAAAAAAGAAGGRPGSGRKGSSKKRSPRAKDSKKKDSKRSGRKKSPRGGASKKKKGGKSPRGKKSGSGRKAAVDEPPRDPPPHPLHLYSTYLTLTAVMDRPLLRSTPPPPSPQLTAADLIPPRAPPAEVPPPLGASEEFRRDVALAVHTIAEQYVAVVREHAAAAEGSREERRRALLAALNTSGIYTALKERLKRTVVRVVRERFHKRTPLHAEDEDELAVRDTFLSQLYTYLMGQAHRAMRIAFDLAEAASASGQVAPPSDPLAPSSTASAAPSEAMARTVGHVETIAALDVPLGELVQAPHQGATPSAASTRRPASPVTASLWALQGRQPGSSQPPPMSATAVGVPHVGPDGESVRQRSLRLALEAEFEGDRPRAAALLQARVASMEQRAARGGAGASWDASLWEDYGEFLLRGGDTGRAAECFREAVAIAPLRVSALTLLGVVQAVRGHPSAALPLLHTARRVLQGDVSVAGEGADEDGALAAGAASAGERGLPLPLPLVETLLSLVRGGYVPPSAPAARGGDLLIATGVVPRPDGPAAGSTPPSPVEQGASGRDGTGVVDVEASGHALVAAVAGLAEAGVGQGGHHDVGAAVAAGLAGSDLGPVDPPPSGSTEGGGSDTPLRPAPRDAADFDAYILVAAWAAKYGPGLLPVLAAAAQLGRACVTDATVPKPVHIRLYILEASAGILAWRGGVPDTLPLALDALDAALALDPECREAWAHRGQVEAEGGSTAAARRSMEMAVGGWQDGPGALAGDTLASTHLLLRMAGVYLAQHEAGVGGGHDAPAPTTPAITATSPAQEGKEAPATAATAAKSTASLAAAAQEVFLRVAASTGWAIAWAGAGRAALRLGALEEAEAALGEANVRDNHSPTIWGLLALLCLSASPPRHPEAAAALGQALKHGLGGARHAALLQELAAGYEAAGKTAIAVQLLRRVLGGAVQGDVVRGVQVAWAGYHLGRLLVQEGEVEEGIAHLSSVLTAAGEEGDGELEEAAASALAPALRQAGHEADAAAVQAQFLDAAQHA